MIFAVPAGIQETCWGFSQPKREIGIGCVQEHHPPTTARLSPLHRPSPWKASGKPNSEFHDILKMRSLAQLTEMVTISTPPGLLFPF